MINSLLIGKSMDIERYLYPIETSKYYNSVQSILISDERLIDFEDIKNKQADAIFFVSPYLGFFELSKYLVKNQIPIYYTHQPNCTNQEILELEKVVFESGSLFFHETMELNHPIFQGFLENQRVQLKFDYQRSVLNKSQILDAVHNALCFITSLSPMPIKHINFQTNALHKLSRHTISIDFELLDYSKCSIQIWIDKSAFHQIKIESATGSFLFDLEASYLENSNGFHFAFDHLSEADLLSLSIEKFALDIILQKNSNFTISFYSLVHRALGKLYHFISNSF